MVTSSALVMNENDPFSYECETALDDAGYVLTFKDATSGKVKIVDGAGEPAVGVNRMATLNPVTLVAEANKVVSILHNGVVLAKLTPHGNRAGSIAIGDWVSTHTDGMIDELEATFTNIVNVDKAVGIALQAVGDASDLPTGGLSGYLLIWLKPRGG